MPELDPQDPGFLAAHPELADLENLSYKQPRSPESEVELVKKAAIGSGTLTACGVVLAILPPTETIGLVITGGGFLSYLATVAYTLRHPGTKS